MAPPRRNRAEGIDAGEKSAATLFVRNLSFDTSNEQLESFFSDVAPVKKAFVVTEPGERAKCRGFGFVHFALKEDAGRAVHVLAGRKLNGRILKIEIANKRASHDERQRGRDAKGPHGYGKDGASGDVGEGGGFGGDGEDDDAFVPTATVGGGARPAHDAVGGSAADAVRLAKRKAAPARAVDRDDGEGERTGPAAEEGKVGVDADDAAVVDGGADEKTTDVDMDANAAGKDASDATGDESEARMRKPKSQRAKPVSAEGRTVVISGLPAGIAVKAVYKRCRKIGAVEKTDVHASPDGPESCAAHVVFASHKDARKALAALDGHVLKGKKVSASLLTRLGKAPNSKSLKRSRVIVRNLPFKADKDGVTTAFGSFGKVLDVTLPCNDAGKPKGFAFVQYGNVFEAAKAIESMNGKALLGRPVAVDWAVAKSQYEKAALVAPAEAEKETRGDVDGDEVEGESEEHDDGDDDGDDDGNDDGDDDGDDDGNDDDDDTMDDDAKEDAAAKTKKTYDDVGTGCTVFVRNVSYDSAEEDLQEAFEHFGRVSLCLLVVDRDTGLPRGTAFIKFARREDADSCIEAARVLEEKSADPLFDPIVSADSPLVVDGRKLSVTRAVDRNEASKLTETKKKEREDKKDNRNMYLAREGHIAPGSDAAAGVSESDMAKRERAQKEKNEKLRNPNFIVSTTRLSVRNLPTFVDDAGLRKLFFDAARKSGVRGHVRVKSAKIMRDRERAAVDTNGRSLGFGFVEFEEHEHALAALRGVNNNPELYGSDKRPIVEFSVENRAALQRKAERLEHSRANLHRGNAAKDGELKAKDSKKPEQGKDSKKPEKGKDSKKPEKGKDVQKGPPHSDDGNVTAENASAADEGASAGEKHTKTKKAKKGDKKAKAAAADAQLPADGVVKPSEESTEQRHKHAPINGNSQRGNSGTQRGNFGAQRGNSGAQRGNFGAQRGNSGAQRGNSDTQRGNSGAQRGNFGTQRGNSGAQRGNSDTQRGNSGAQRGNFGAQRGNSGSQRGNFGAHRGNGSAQRGMSGTERGRGAASASRPSANREVPRGRPAEGTGKRKRDFDADDAPAKKGRRIDSEARDEAKFANLVDKYRKRLVQGGDREATQRWFE